MHALLGSAGSSLANALLRSRRQKPKGKPWPLETVKATLECARADAEEETDRMKVLDQKLTSIAAFSGVALSIGGSVGASVVVSGKLTLGFTIALGAVLSFAVCLLLAGATAALVGLMPKEYRGITLETANKRVTPARLSLEPADALAKLAATYYTDVLPQARAANSAKVDAVRRAYRLVTLGLGGLALALILSAVAAVV